MTEDEKIEMVARAIAQADEQNGAPPYEYRIKIGRSKDLLFDQAKSVIELYESDGYQKIIGDINGALYGQTTKPYEYVPLSKDSSMTSELKTDLTSFGYADGGYMSKCRHCKETFLGAKRSWSCKPCAIKRSNDPKITRAVPDVLEFEADKFTKKPDDHIWVKCLYCPNSITHQHYDYCGLCLKCSKVLIQCDAPIPDVPGLVRYDKEFESMFEREDGKYVLHSQAAEIIAAKDAEIAVGDVAIKQNALLWKRAEAAEAKLAQYEAQEPVAVRHGWDGDGFQYIDNGSGSDWKSRKQDGEFLYAAPVSEPNKEEEIYELIKRLPLIIIWDIKAGRACGMSNLKAFLNVKPETTSS